MKDSLKTETELVNEWRTEIVKSPVDYVNDKKLEYQARIDASVDAFRVDLSKISYDITRAQRSSKWRILETQLETKMAEIHGSLTQLRTASIESWEDIKTRIEINLAFIKKHLEKMTVLEKRRS